MKNQDKCISLIVEKGIAIKKLKKYIYWNQKEPRTLDKYFTYLIPISIINLLTISYFFFKKMIFIEQIYALLFILIIWYMFPFAKYITKGYDRTNVLIMIYTSFIAYFSMLEYSTFLLIGLIPLIAKNTTAGLLLYDKMLKNQTMIYLYNKYFPKL